MFYIGVGKSLGYEFPSPMTAMKILIGYIAPIIYVLLLFNNENVN